MRVPPTSTVASAWILPTDEQAGWDKTLQASLSLSRSSERHSYLLWLSSSSPLSLLLSLPPSARTFDPSLASLSSRRAASLRQHAQPEEPKPVQVCWTRAHGGGRASGAGAGRAFLQPTKRRRQLLRDGWVSRACGRGCGPARWQAPASRALSSRHASATQRARRKSPVLSDQQQRCTSC